MGSVTLKPQNYYGWSGYSLSNGEVELGIVPEIGGRIISCRVQGEELFYVDKNRKGETFDLGKIDDLMRYKTVFGFRLWGGDKTWVAPEKKWMAGIPPLHLDAGKYRADVYSTSIHMTSPIDQETGLQIIRCISMAETGEIELVQKFTNCGNQSLSCGIWNVTQLTHPFHIYFQADKKNVKPDKRFIASVRDVNEWVDQKGHWMGIHCEKPLQFKYSSHLYPGVVLAIRKHLAYTLVMARRFAVSMEAEYPHEGIVEVYNSDHDPYLELEILSPLVDLQPGDQTTHQQHWSFRKFDCSVDFSEIVNYFMGRQ